MSAPSIPRERSVSNTHLSIPGSRDLAVLAYCEWQQSKVVDEGQKRAYQKARDVMLREMLEYGEQPGKPLQNQRQAGRGRGHVHASAARI